MKRYVSLIGLLVVCMIVGLFSGCEKPAEYSTETVVCEFHWGGGYGTIYDAVGLNIRVYADNTVKAYAGPFYDDQAELAMEEICPRTYTITDEQMDELLRAMERNRVNTIGSCPDNHVMDGKSYSIRLFDASGENVVYSCGGYATTNRRFWRIGNIVRAFVPAGEMESLKAEAIAEIQTAQEKAMEETFGEG